MTVITFATRPSALARWQTGWVIRRLQEAWPQVEWRETVITTQGDRILDRPLPEIGGKGLFTQELEAELLSGRVDAAVHSLKDLPVEDPSGLVVAAVPARADARDVLISAQGYTLADLPAGAVVGTSSLRRSSQLLALRPDLKIMSLRGNVDTRLRKARQGEYDAIILAGAGVSRLGLQEHITQWLPLDVMLPAPGQGALAVQCRRDDHQVFPFLEILEDAPTRQAVTAERAFLAGLGGGCALPVAAFAEVTSQGIRLAGMAASADGARLVRAVEMGDQPREVGENLARRLLAQGVGAFLYG